MTTLKSNTTLYLTVSALTIFMIANVGAIVFLGLKGIKKGWVIVTSIFGEGAAILAFNDYLNFGLIVCGVVIVYNIIKITSDKITVTKTQINSNNKAKINSVESNIPRNRDNSNYNHDNHSDVIGEFSTEKLKSEDAKELEEAVGLQIVNEQVRKLKATLNYERKHGGFTGKKKAHMAFVGNPGTGKTMVAKGMAAIFYDAGAIKRPVFMSINAIELMGKYLGSTGPTVEHIFKLCRGGVLFIDEAYALCQSAIGGYANEAVNCLLTQLENNPYDVTVIFAGYEEEINQLLGMNPGLKSRIQHTIDFPDYSPNELTDITKLHLKRMKHELPTELKDSLVNLFAQKINFCKYNGITFSNGRYARNVAENIHTSHAMNYMDNPGIGTAIVAADLNFDELFRLD